MRTHPQARLRGQRRGGRPGWRGGRSGAAGSRRCGRGDRRVRQPRLLRVLERLHRLTVDSDVPAPEQLRLGDVRRRSPRRSRRRETVRGGSAAGGGRRPSTWRAPKAAIGMTLAAAGARKPTVAPSTTSSFQSPPPISRGATSHTRNTAGAPPSTTPARTSKASGPIIRLSRVATNPHEQRRR